MGHKGKIVSQKIYSDEKKFFMLSIDDIEIGTEELDNAIAEISLDADNLFYLLQEDQKTDENLKKILLSFSCSESFSCDEEIERFIDINISKTKSFYSFLAEMLQALLLKDVCGYRLLSSVINYNFNPALTDQGPDSCLYSEEDKKVVLGEAKFIESQSECFNNIIDDFKRNHGIIGKLKTLCTAAQNDPSARTMIISHLNEETLKVVGLEDFLKNDIIFCGFALHNSMMHKEKYYDKDFYDSYKIEINEIKEHIRAIYESDYSKTLENLGKYKIIIFHLPIESKRSLILKIIKESQKRFLGL